MAIEDLNSRAELFRAVRENLESEPLPTSAVDGLQEGLQGGKWVAPELLNGWSNFGGGWSQAAYRTLPGGLIGLRGLVGHPGEGAANTTIFILPVQARPKENQLFGGGNSSGTASLIKVQADGQVVYGGAATTIEYVSLSSIIFGVGS